MRILIIDDSTEAQAKYAHRIQGLPISDLETMDISVVLSNKNEYRKEIESINLVVLGSALGDRAYALAREIKETFPKIHLILFANEENYSSREIRNAHYFGIRKVLPDTVQDLDLMQELIAIDAEHRRNDKMPLGKVYLLVSPKGGSGTTSLTAALAEMSSIAGKKSLIWDLDYETQDLCRALSLYADASTSKTTWITTELSRKLLKDNLIRVDRNTHLLPAPQNTRQGFFLLGSEDGIELLQRVIDLSRYSNDNIFIDMGCGTGPGCETLMNLADQIILLTGSCALGVTAAEIFVSNVIAKIGNADKVKFLYTGSKLSANRVKQDLEPSLKLGEQAWTLPTLRHDEKAAEWAATGRTLFTLGSATTRSQLNIIAMRLGIIEEAIELHEPKGFLNNLSERLITKDPKAEIRALPMPEGYEVQEKSRKLNLIRKAVGY